MFVHSNVTAINENSFWEWIHRFWQRNAGFYLCKKWHLTDKYSSEMSNKSHLHFTVLYSMCVSLRLNLRGLFSFLKLLLKKEVLLNDMFQTSLAMLLCLSMAVLCNRVSPPSRGPRSRLLSVRPLHWGLLGAAKCQAIRSVFGSGIPSGPGALRADVGSGRLLFQLLQLPHGPQVSSSSLLTQRPPVLSCKADLRGGTQNTKRFLLIYSFVCLSSVFHLDELVTRPSV